MSIRGPKSSKEADISAKQRDVPFSQIIASLSHGMHYSSNSKQYVLALTKQFLEEHNTCDSTVNMTKAKPTYMENILVYEKHAKQPCYSLQWIIGYFISDYCDLRNSFIMWICDKLQSELQTHLESTNELLAEGTISQINTPPFTVNIDNSQSTSMLYQSSPEETNEISYEFLLQYYTYNQYLVYNSLLLQNLQNSQIDPSLRPEITKSPKPTIKKTKVTLDEDKIAKAKDDPLAIDLCYRGSLRYHCANCTCGVIVPAPNNRPGKNSEVQFDDLHMDTRNKLAYLIFGVMETLIASIVHDPFDVEVPSKIQLLSHYFSNKTDLLKAIIKHVMLKSQRKAIELRKFTKQYINSSLQNLDTENSVYFLDWNLMSLTKWENLRKFFNLVHVLKHRNTLSNSRQKINKQIIIEFKYTITTMNDTPSETGANSTANALTSAPVTDVRPKPKATPKGNKRGKASKKKTKETSGIGHALDPIEVVKSLLQIEENECGNLDHLGNVLKIKASVDGSKKVVVFTLTLLNCKVFAVQSRDSCILISMYSGDEGEEEFNKHFAPVLPGITSLCKDGLRHNDQDFRCELYIVNDWKAFKYFTDMFDNGMFCAFCECPLKDRHKSYAPNAETSEYVHYNARVVVFKNDLEGAVARYCILHSKCRTHENLMTSIITSRNDLHMYDKIAERIRKYPTLKNFAWREERYDEDDDNVDQTIKRFPFSRGIQITELMINTEHTFHDIADECEMLLLKLNRFIHLVYLEADSETLQRRDKGFLKDCCKTFGILFAYRYPNVRGSYYYHYIVRHVPEEAERAVVWSQLQNQGAEAFHSTHNLMKENASSKGGGRNKIAPDQQRFFLLARRVYLAKRYGLKWVGQQSDYNKRVYDKSSLDSSNASSPNPQSRIASNATVSPNPETRQSDTEMEDEPHETQTQTIESSVFVDEEEEDGEYVMDMDDDDDDDDDEWDRNDSIIEEPENLLNDTIDINRKISEELIHKWCSDIEPHVRGVVTEGVSYLRRTFALESSKAHYAERDFANNMNSGTATTHPGDRSRKRQRVEEPDSENPNGAFAIEQHNVNAFASFFGL